jgi:hypothetical protein
VYSLLQVLDALRRCDPNVLAFFVNRDCGLGKARLGERANRDCYAFLVAFGLVVHGCPASRAEAEGGLASFITDSNVLRRSTPDLDALLAEASLSTHFRFDAGMRGSGRHRPERVRQLLLR